MTKYNFLDITLDLTNKCHMPYNKENSSIKYINRSSNHPMTIKNNLPKMIEERLIRLSTDPNIFDDAKPCYENALSKSNFKHKLKHTYEVKLKEKKKRKRTRNVMFFNPPFCQLVKTNIGKRFLEFRQTFQKREHEKNFQLK